MSSFFGLAQQVPIGQWRSHLPYSDAIAVSDAGNRVYCATRNGLFYFNKNDNVTERISTINGLAEVQISAMKFNMDQNILVIGYSSGNIDLIQNSEVINMPFIKNKNITGGKGINNISMIGKYALLSCDFGIVAINLEKQEISDTYYLGPTSNLVKVNDVTFDNVYYYAATNKGIFKALATNPFLSDYNSWTLETALVAENYNSIAFFNGIVFANYLETKNSIQYDTIFVLKDNQWTYFDWDTAHFEVRRLGVSGDRLIITSTFSCAFFNASGIRTNYASGYSDGHSSPYEAVIAEGGIIWIADDGAGLIRNTDQYIFTPLTPNGPSNNGAWTMNFASGTLCLSTGSYDNTLAPLYSRKGLHIYRDNLWVSYTDRNFAAFDTITDIVCVVVDPRDADHIYAGSWGKGLLEFYKGNLIKIFGADGTSTLGVAPGTNSIFVGGLAYDKDNNLWITNSEAQIPISVIRANGTWQSVPIVGYPNWKYSTSIVIDEQDVKWVVQPRTGTYVAFTTNTNPPTLLPIDSISSSVFSLSPDKEGQIWLGTAEGVYVKYSTESAPEKIFVQQDGHTEYLLETETVTAIAIDGANRKWFGTSGGGVFLMSADGANQIHHFSEENSPLLSNSIRSIQIDPIIGEVFFGTDKGLISYRGTATEGNEEMKDVVVFPNPVRENYSGLIGIKGLTENADVKITDAAGNLVFETTALGGQAVWDGKNKSGKKSQTGVYLVFCSNSDGKKKAVAKIFFIN